MGTTAEQEKKIAEEIGLTPGTPSALRRHIASCSIADAEEKASAQAGTDATSAARRAKESRLQRLRRWYWIFPD